MPVDLEKLIVDLSKDFRKQEDTKMRSGVKVLVPHPLAELFPLLPEAELRRLADDIAKRGLEQPITLFEGKILDGRNRYEACHSAGVPLRTVNYAGDDPRGFVFSQNLHRRHLKESQRALIAATLVNWPIGTNQATASSANLPVWKAADLLAVSPRTVKNAQKLLRSRSPSIDLVRRGELTLHAAMKPASERTVHAAGSPYAAVVEIIGTPLGDVLWADLLPLAERCMAKARRLTSDARVLEAIARHVTNVEGGATVENAISPAALTEILRSVPDHG